MSMIRSSYLTGLAALASIAASADAAIIYSGARNLTIPADPVGLYVNVATGAFETPVPLFYPQGAARDADIQIGGSFLRSLYVPTAGSQNTLGISNAHRGYVVNPSDPEQAAALAAGTPIGPASLMDSSFGPYADDISTGQPVLIGFRFRNEVGGANTVHYGWGRLSMVDGQPGTLIDYAYESTPNLAIAAGAVPEPASAMALLAGAALIRRRR